jgi:hypothetical protein
MIPNEAKIREVIKDLDGFRSVCDGRKMDERLANHFSYLIYLLEESLEGGEQK